MLTFSYKEITYTPDTGLLFENFVSNSDYYFDTKAINSYVYTQENKFEIEGALNFLQFQLDTSSIY